MLQIRMLQMQCKDSPKTENFACFKCGFVHPTIKLAELEANAEDGTKLACESCNASHVLRCRTVPDYYGSPRKSSVLYLDLKDEPFAQLFFFVEEYDSAKEETVATEGYDILCPWCSKVLPEDPALTHQDIVSTICWFCEKPIMIQATEVVEYTVSKLCPDGE